MNGKKEIGASVAPQGEGRSNVARVLDWGEFAVAELLSLSGLLWLVLMMIHAGPLWRDELCSVNLAESASLKVFWEHLHHDSCPILWPAILRGWLWLGLSGNPEIRVLGFLIGVCMLASPWLIARWVGKRVPILSASLLAFSPAVLFTASSLRAYGLGSLMLVLTVGLTWRAVEHDSPGRLAWLAVSSILAAHSLYT
ncbi:MAG: hypothetical protein JXL84_17300, partial [Deltaproteobacteria bacterium]|nr:hypothetical protein [Deltaproteobacteria bacterium]